MLLKADKPRPPVHDRGVDTTPEIARTLFISPNTLRTHTKHVFTKLGVSSRREAVARARERGLLAPTDG